MIHGGFVNDPDPMADDRAVEDGARNCPLTPRASMIGSRRSIAGGAAEHRCADRS